MPFFLWRPFETLSLFSMTFGSQPSFPGSSACSSSSLLRSWGCPGRGRSADAIRLLNDDLAQVTQDLHVERVWRLAGGDGSPIGQCMPPGSVQRFRDNDMHSNKGLKARRMNQI
ncbi:hypothetical protein [Rhizobium sp. K102]|jgi:hypothetical protein|uniref:hypothetical protein n=1 Tax=Rhizobium sp. K102 TaxID=2918527 RepID=UPI001EFB38E0|nr:hypothetical protein [Rhizobium sp. K102]ULR45033.1 hypothetical protein MHI61_07330 [Rhizobium sp. K102]